MKDAFIVDGIRTPIGNFTGTLSSVRADDMGAMVIKELVKRNPSLDPAAIEDVIMGCANQAGDDNRNVARMSLLLAGLPVTVPGETVNRLCASGMSATANAVANIKSGVGSIFISGGVENMTRGPWVISKTSTPFGRDAQMFDSSFGWRFINPKMQEMYGTDGMGETAENLADMYKINREDQDKFALWSQQKATAAQERGRFTKEILPVSIAQKKGDAIQFLNDEFIKSNTTLEGLGKLRPAFRKDGTVTAGNASGLNDGAAALLVASEEGLKQYNLKPLTRVVSYAVMGVESRIMGYGPVPAVKKALERAGLTWNDIGLLELNEAFAAQALACTRAWKLDDNDSRINPNGGAIALGHPLGMSGARLLQTASIEMHERNVKYAVCTMCIGVGQGFAMVLEKV